MKKNIFIAILILIIFILLYKILHPSVVTQRKIPSANISSELKNDNADTQKTQDENLSTESPLKPEFRINNDSSYQSGGNVKFSDVKYKHDNKNNQNSEISYNSVNANSGGYTNVYVKDYSAQNDFNNKHQNRVKSEQSQAKTMQKSLSMCSPYKETLTTEYMGMSMTYTIDILGWVNNKCVLNFESHINGTGNSFSDMYDVPADSAQVFGFAPKVRCEFTKKQLLYVGDNILEENNRNRNMLKNPDQIEFPDLSEMSFSDLKLLQIILNDRACKVINADDFIQIFEGLFQF